MNIDGKKLIPHIVAVAVFIIVAVIYCKPALDGKILNASDNFAWKGMAQQSFETKEKYGRFPLWTNSMFSGMPTYQIALDGTHKISYSYVHYLFTLGLPKPINFFFLSCLCFYILCLALSINPWVGIIGALSYAYSTYDPIIVFAGHDTKMLAMGYAPLAIAGLLLLFQKRWWVGSATLATGFYLQLSMNHVQITYYTLLIMGFLAFGFFIESVNNKEFKPFFKSIAIASIIGVISLGGNAVIMFTTWDYSKESMRGGVSELKETKDKNTTAGGLDKDYAFMYSVGIAETFTLAVPGLYGGSNGGKEYKVSKFADKLTEIGQPEDLALQYANEISYWGEQQPTSGPAYIGAVICVLLFFSFFIEAGWLKWSLLTAGIFGIVLAWGKHFEGVNYFLFDYLPLYKKFRAPSMALVMPQLTFVLLSCLGLQKLINNKIAEVDLKKYLRNTAITSVVLLAIVGVMYFSFNYSSPGDKNVSEQFSYAMLQQLAKGGQPTIEMQQEADRFGKSFVSAIQEDRKSLFAQDFMRSFLFIVFSLGILFAAVYKKMKKSLVMIALLVLSSFDLLSIGRRYLNYENFVEPSDFDNAFAMTEADKQIKQDKGYFRVINLMTNPFNESITSYHHNCVGGHHPAKLQIYQDLIENQLAKNNIQVLNMLNTKYFIVRNSQTGKPIAQQNPDAFGPAWFVKGIKYVANGKEEMKALDSTNLRDTAVVQTKFKSLLAAEPAADSTASIRLIENKNDIILYESNAETNQFAVFSEIYYSAGWRAFIDEKKTDYVKTNYALRGMAVPAGKHRIEFRFEPVSYKIGNDVAMISSLIIFAIVLGGLIMEWKLKRMAQAKNFP